MIIIKPRLTRHMSVTKEDESQALIADLRFVTRRFEIWGKMGFEIWLNDLNLFIELFEIWREMIWDLPITVVW